MRCEHYVLLLYALWVILLGVVHSEILMLISLFGVGILGGTLRWRILRRSVAVVALFAGSVSLAYALFMPDAFSVLLLINLRALALTQLSFTLVSRVNLHKLFATHSLLGMLYAFTYAQIIMLRQLFIDYMYGLKSRSGRLGGIYKTSKLQPLLATLFAKMLKRSEEQVMALRSRGLLDD